MIQEHIEIEATLEYMIPYSCGKTTGVSVDDSHINSNIGFWMMSNAIQNSIRAL